MLQFLEILKVTHFYMGSLGINYSLSFSSWAGLKEVPEKVKMHIVGG